MTDVWFLRQALADLRAAHSWYEEQRSGLGDEFADVVDAAVGKPTAYLVLATGVMAFAFMGSYAVEALSPLRIVNALLVTAWYVLAGVGLYRLARR